MSHAIPPTRSRLPGPIDYRPRSQPYPGYKLWLRADRGITKDGSDRVSAWNDASDLSNHASQTSSSEQPLWIEDGYNGVPILRFSGSQWMQCANPSNFNIGLPIILIFGRQATSSLGGSFTGKNSAARGDGARRKLQVNGSVYASGQDSQAATFPAYPTGLFRIYSVLGTAANNHTLTVNDQQATSTTTLDIATFNTEPLRIGRPFEVAAEYLDGDIGEILIYDATDFLEPILALNRSLQYMQNFWGFRFKD